MATTVFLSVPDGRHGLVYPTSGGVHRASLHMHHCGALGRSLRQNEEEEAVYLTEVGKRAI